MKDYKLHQFKLLDHVELQNKKTFVDFYDGCDGSRAARIIIEAGYQKDYPTACAIRCSCGKHHTLWVDIYDLVLVDYHPDFKAKVEDRLKYANENP